MLRNKRWLRTNKLEFFEINSLDNDTLGYLVIVDTRRERRLSDFPEWIGVETEESFIPNFNHIKVVIFQLQDIDEKYLEYEYLFIEDLLGLKPDCSYHVSEFKIETALAFDMPDRMIDIVKFVNELLSMAKMNIEIELTNPESFNYLSKE